MPTITTSYTTSSNPEAAATDLVRKAREGLEGDPTLAVLFATTQYDTQGLVACAFDSLHGVPLWGGSSSSGIFTEAGWITADTGAAGLMLISDRQAGVGVAEVGEDPEDAGRRATQAAIDGLRAPAGALLTISFMGPEEAILEGVSAVAPGVPVAGGTSSDHSPDGKFQQFANGTAYQGHVAVAALAGPVGHAFTNGYRPTGKVATVTKAEGRRAYELGHRRAMDVYAEWVGRPETEIGGGAILAFSVQHPLLFHKDGLTYSAHPVNTNPDGSIDFGAAMAPGMVLELGENSVNGLIAEAGTAAHAAAKDVEFPKGVVLAYCGGRAIALGERIGEIPGEVEHTLGALPLIGYLAFGEQGTAVRGIPTHADLSVSTLVLG
jgi:hypothetical protein